MTERKAMPGWVKGLLFVLALAVLVAAVVVIIKYAPRPPREMLDADAGTPVRIEIREIDGGRELTLYDPETFGAITQMLQKKSFHYGGELGCGQWSGYDLSVVYKDGTTVYLTLMGSPDVKCGSRIYTSDDLEGYDRVWNEMDTLIEAGLRGKLE